MIEWSDEDLDINELVAIVESIGYRALPFMAEDILRESDKIEKDLLKRLSIAGAVSAQVMMILFGVWASIDNNSMGQYTRVLLHIIAGIISIPAVFYAGMPFFRSAISALKNRRSNMDVPISIGVIATTVISIQETFRIGEYAYYDAAIGLIFILLIGRYLDIKSRNKANSAVRELIMNRPFSVTIFENDQYRVLDIRRASLGQIAFVSAGEIIPVDGVIIHGCTEVDNSIITGESNPVSVKIGDSVYAGSINLIRPIKVKITKSSESTVISEMINLIEKASQSRSKYVTLAEKISSYYTIFVLIAALITFASWYFVVGSSVSQSLLYSISVLIITCPCALGLAVPIVQVVTVLKLMKSGVLVKSSNALEKISQITDIVFDKTGTLTYGQPIWINKNEIDHHIMQIIYSIAFSSKHPLMKAVALEKSPDMNLLDLEVTEEKGMGMRSFYNGQEILIGNRLWCGINDDNQYDDYQEVWFRYMGYKYRLVFKDILRNEVRSVINTLKNSKVNLHVFSGDRIQNVESVAKDLGIESYFGNLRPEDKYMKVYEMQCDGKNVLMIGDGINDVPALKLSHVSISPSNAIDWALNNADIVFQRDFFSLIKIINISRFYIVLIKQNFLLSFFYNIITIPIAMLGFVTPLMAAIIMSGSSLSVVFNAMRINFKK